MEFKDVFKSRRQALKLSLKDVAEAVGVSVPTAQRWESGEIKNLRRDKIQKLASVLDVPVEKLMGWSESPTPAVPTEFYLAARKMGEITEEQRQHIFKQLDSTIDIFLAAKRSAKEEK